MNFVTFIRNETKMTSIRDKNDLYSRQKWAFRYESDYEFLADSDRTKSHKWRNLP